MTISAGAGTPLGGANEPPTLEAYQRAVSAEREAREQLESQSVELEQQIEELQSVQEELEQANEELLTSLNRLEEARQAEADARAAIAASEARYKALVDASTLMVWNTNAAGLIEDMPFWRELTGQTTDEVRGSGWANAIHPADQQRTGELWRAAYDSRKVYDAEYRLRLKDGSYRWFQARGVPITNESGDVTEWVGIFNDIDEKRKGQLSSQFIGEASKLLSESLDYEETLRAIANAAVPALGDWCAVDILVDPLATEWPPRVQRLAVVHSDPEKVSLAHELAARYPTDWSLPSGLPRVIRERTSELLPSIPDELLVQTARDAEHLAIIRALGIKSAIIVPLVARGRILGGLTLVSSESERRYDEHDLRVAEDLAQRAAMSVDNARLHRDVLRARADSESASRAKSEFLTTMSHELRTPLNAIDGYAELLEIGVRGPLTPTQLADVARIRRSQKHLLGLVNDILQLSRIEAGKVEYHLESVPVTRVLASVREIVEPQALNKQLRFEIDDPDHEVAALADEERLRQIMLNLLSNAVKFTPVEGEVAVRCNADAEHVRLSVEDSGPGIPASRWQDIFEPFVQLARDEKRQTTGTGLGLAISRDLARGMSGEITVESSGSGGARFTVVLPRHQGGVTG